MTVFLYMFIYQAYSRLILYSVRTNNSTAWLEILLMKGKVYKWTKATTVSQSVGNSWHGKQNTDITCINYHKNVNTMYPLKGKPKTNFDQWTNTKYFDIKPSTIQIQTVTLGCFCNGDVKGLKERLIVDYFRLYTEPVKCVSQLLID